MEWLRRTSEYGKTQGRPNQKFQVPTLAYCLGQLACGISPARRTSRLDSCHRTGSRNATDAPCVTCGAGGGRNLTSPSRTLRQGRHTAHGRPPGPRPVDACIPSPGRCNFKTNKKKAWRDSSVLTLRTPRLWESARVHSRKASKKRDCARSSVL